MEAVIYARVSTSLQTPNSQTEICAEYANNNGYEIQGMYIDNGFSSLEKRPSFQKMLRYLKEHPDTIVLVASMDRITRDKDEFFRYMERYKIEIAKQILN